jgi:LPXTG-site transpeptidase (sortase) family protein
MVLKLNSAGAYQWHTFYGSAGFDFANGMAVDGGGTIFVTGYSPDTWNGPGATTPLYPFQGSSDIFVLRLTSAGAYQRHAFFGSSDNEAGYSVVTDAGGDAYVSGITYATSWDGPGPTAPLHAIGGNQDITVIRLDNDTTSPAVTGSDPANNVTIATGPSQIEVDFSEDVLHDAGGSAANSTANYLLVEDGTNAVFDTVSCLGGVQGDDVQQSITGIAYDNNDRAGPFAATLTLGTALLDGHYRLLVCGTTTIEDLAVNELNGGLADTPITFTVRAGAGGGGTELPEAGFAPGVVTILPSQPAARAYTDEQMWLEIPSLALKGSIVGVPHSEDGWDVTWLGDEIGWLTGTAFPTWDGNTGLVGHAYDAFGKPGPFAGLGSLKWGDQIIVHAWGQEHVYEVRMINNLVKPDDARLLNRHETLPWLTLVTCRGYDEKSDQYKYRTIVRAVLVKVSPETR